MVEDGNDTMDEVYEVGSTKVDESGAGIAIDRNTEVSENHFLMKTLFFAFLRWRSISSVFSAFCCAAAEFPTPWLV